jgi:cysteine desulfurase family protein (TIGR01976 family)
MTYDVRRVRDQFPALDSGTAFFDGPGGSQTPVAVADAIRDALLRPLSNRGRTTAAERNADDIVTGARQAVADLLGAEAGGVVFGRSMTGLTYQLSQALAKDWTPGDEIVVTRLDHDANVRPWVQAAEAAGATVRWADFDPATGELTAEDVSAVVGARTRLVAVTGASNLIGTRPPLAAIGAVVHGAGALFAVDGVHLAAHALVDIAAMGADFFACSPYKFLGPHCGVLAGAPSLLETIQADKLLPATNSVPERFELGTLPYELLAGTTAAIDVLAGLDDAAAGSRRERLATSLAALEEYEDDLRRPLESALASLPGVRVHSRAVNRTPTLLVTFDGRDAGDAYRFLAARNVNAPAGSFYAIEPSRRLGLGEAGGLRIGLAPYTDAQDVDRLLEGLQEFTAASH